MQAKAARPSRVRLFEVGPRDGLQNESQVLDVEARARFVRALAGAGLEDIEIGAFVHPKWVPQMAGTDALARELGALEGVRTWALVPNARGLERAEACGVRHIGLLTSASEGHAKRNLNRSVEESAAINDALAKDALAAGMTLRGYVSVAFGCPYEGAVPFERVLGIAERFLESGCDHVSIGDTVGFAHPDALRAASAELLERFGPERFALHLHDTRGLGLANALAALEEGVAFFDGAVGGLGGCPYAPGAAGNLSTEGLVHMLDELGVETGVSAAGLVGAARALREAHGIALSSPYARYLEGREASAAKGEG